MKYVLLIASLLLVNCSTMGPKSEFKLRPYKMVTLKNGLKVYLIEDRSLPYFSARLLVKSGGTSDPQNKRGLANLTTSLLNKGTKEKTALQLADDLEQVGAETDFYANNDYIMGSMSTLSFYRDAVFQDFVDMVTRPSFKNSEIKKDKSKILAGIKKRVDSPSHFAEFSFQSYLYGDHPYAIDATGTYSSVQEIKRSDIVKFHNKHFTPNNSILAVVGAVDDKFVGQLESYFSHWKNTSVSHPEMPEMPEIDGLKIQVVDKNDMKQSQIRFGHPGIKRTNPDFLALRVANSILGSGFNSRLFDEVRIKRGLTYSIYSYFDARKERGPFQISTFSRHEKVGETISVTLDILKDFQENGIKEEELELAKGYLKGQFPNSLETPEQVAYNLIVLEFYGIGVDYLNNYIENIEKISRADVNRAIRKYFTPEQMKILVYTNKDEVLSQLQPLGTVNVKDYKEFL